MTCHDIFVKITRISLRHSSWDVSGKDTVFSIRLFTESSTSFMDWGARRHLPEHETAEIDVTSRGIIDAPSTGLERRGLEGGGSGALARGGSSPENLPEANRLVSSCRDYGTSIGGQVHVKNSCVVTAELPYLCHRGVLPKTQLIVRETVR